MGAPCVISSILVLMGILAIFVGDSATVMGQSQGASFHIVYGDKAATNPNDVRVVVACNDTYGYSLPVATLVPVDFVDHTWTPNSFPNDIWTCYFSASVVSVTTRTFAQSFPVWKHDNDASNYLNLCADCQWKILGDGFYWFSVQENAWQQKYQWVQTS